MNILVTGSDGFIAKNLIDHLLNYTPYNVLKFNKKTSLEELNRLLDKSDYIIHLAADNRPETDDGYRSSINGLTEKIILHLRSSKKITPIIFTSSVQVGTGTAYGEAKKKAELSLIDLHKEHGNPLTIYRLPGVFGKWCKPNHNSVIATFCHNISRNIPIQVNDPLKTLNLVYIDDVVKSMVFSLLEPPESFMYQDIDPTYRIGLGELSEQIYSFRKLRAKLAVDEVGSGLIRALYSTYLSYLPNEQFAYALDLKGDSRGEFAEVLKTKSSGQFSFLTINEGHTRGGHYHHTKSEKFLVVCGIATYKSRNILTNEIYEIKLDSNMPRVVDSIPGWSHEITNIGIGKAIVLLWSNEIFDDGNPDTLIAKITNE